MSDREMTRKALYELVWSAPSVEVAAQLGISDVGLTKVCRKHRIPKPPRGYWAQKKVGRSVRRSPLPPLRPSQEQLVTIKFEFRRRASAKLVESGTSPHMGPGGFEPPTSRLSGV